MVYFMSNHTDVKFLESYLGRDVKIIKHPYIDPEWDAKDIAKFCSDVIDEAVEANYLVLNGDYTLVSIIVLKRAEIGKSSGFIAMKKLNEPSNEKDKDGNIIHRNVLKPVGIRWV